MKQFKVLQVSWADMELHLRTIRTRVFIEEQSVSADLEWDGLDIDCIHLLVKKNDIRTIEKINNIIFISLTKLTSLLKKSIIKILQNPEIEKTSSSI